MAPATFVSSYEEVKALPMKSGTVIRGEEYRKARPAIISQKHEQQANHAKGLQAVPCSTIVLAQLWPIPDSTSCTTD